MGYPLILQKNKINTARVCFHQTANQIMICSFWPWSYFLYKFGISSLLSSCPCNNPLLKNCWYIGDLGKRAFHKKYTTQVWHWHDLTSANSVNDMIYISFTFERQRRRHNKWSYLSYINPQDSGAVEISAQGCTLAH